MLSSFSVIQLFKTGLFLASSDFGMNRKQWGSSQEASSECLFSLVLYPKSYSEWEVHHANSVNHCPNHHLLEADLSFV